jgi:hypothetical protein
MTMKRTWLVMLTGVLLWLVSSHFTDLRGEFRAAPANAQRAAPLGQALHLSTPGELLLIGAVAVGFMAARRLG